MTKSRLLTGCLTLLAIIVASVAVFAAEPNLYAAEPFRLVADQAPTPAIIDTGTLAGQALTWVVTTFGGVLGMVITAYVVKLLKKAGLENADLLRNRIDDMAVNGLNYAASQAAGQLAGKGQIEIKNQLAAQAVTYVQQHGADTIKQLGLDPTSPEAVQAITARIEKVINDPAAPTPPVLDPAKPAAAAANP